MILILVGELHAKGHVKLTSDWKIMGKEYQSVALRLSAHFLITYRENYFGLTEITFKQHRIHARKVDRLTIATSMAICPSESSSASIWGKFGLKIKNNTSPCCVGQSSLKIY